MFISKSLSSKITVSIMAIALVIIGCIMAIEYFGVQRMMCNQIKAGARVETELMYMGIEKPMVIGDNKGTAEEFKKIQNKFSSVTAYMTSYAGNITYSTDESSLRKDFSKIEKNSDMAALHGPRHTHG